MFRREGSIQFIKGEVYVSNMSKTTGHLSSVTSVDWHPHDKSICLTSSLDGLARLWNVDRGKTQFKMLTSDKVFQFQKVQFCTCAKFSPNARQIAVSTQSGTIQIWNIQNTNRPIRIITPTTTPPNNNNNNHPTNTTSNRIHNIPIHSIAFNVDGT